MERNELIPFGKKIQVGNFYIVKVTKTLSSKELKSLRDSHGLPSDIQKHLNRGGLPYIVINTNSGSWSICFVIGSTMYNFIETEFAKGESGKASLLNLFTFMLTDTCILGDNEYIKAKGEALMAFMERIGINRGETAEEKRMDDEILEDLKTEQEAKANLKEITKTYSEELRKEEQDGE